MSESRPAFASVELPLGVSPAAIHCPVCGTRTEEDETGGSCTHLQFIYVGDVGDFVYQSGDFTKRRLAAEAAYRKEMADGDPDSEDDLDIAPDLETLLERLGYDSSFLVIEQTYGGMACGPVWSTDTYCFAFEGPETIDEPDA